MPDEIRRQVTSESRDPAADHVSQTMTTTQVPTETEAKDAQSDKGNAWVWYVVGIIDLLLLLRIVFRLFGAKSAGFTDLLYGVTSPFVAPFRGIFPSPSVEGSYFDTAALVAIIIYALIGWLIAGLINLAIRPTNSR